MILWNFRFKDQVKKGVTVKYRNDDVEINQMDYEKENLCRSQVLIMTSYQWKVFKADKAIYSYNSKYKIVKLIEKLVIKIILIKWR